MGISHAIKLNTFSTHSSCTYHRSITWPRLTLIKHSLYCCRLHRPRMSIGPVSSKTFWNLEIQNMTAKMIHLLLFCTFLMPTAAPYGSTTIVQKPSPPRISKCKRNSTIDRIQKQKDVPDCRFDSNAPQNLYCAKRNFSYSIIFGDNYDSSSEFAQIAIELPNLPVPARFILDSTGRRKNWRDPVLNASSQNRRLLFPYFYHSTSMRENCFGKFNLYYEYLLRFSWWVNLRYKFDDLTNFVINFNECDNNFIS